jgi:hypothetical protein
MSTIKLVNLNEQGAKVNFHVDLDSRGARGYETDVLFNQDEYGNWTASIDISGMPDQKSPADCADKLSKYLLELSRAVKAKNIKHLNIDSAFNSVHKK